MDAQPYLAWLMAHTYVVVLIATAIDATAFPFPGRVLLVGAGAVAAEGHVSLAGVVAIGAFGALAVDHLWYFAGAFGTRRLFAFVSWLTARPARRARRTAREYFERWGAFVFVVGRFVAVVRVVAWPLARPSGIGYARFVVYDAFAATAWALVWAGVGYVLRDRWEAAMAGGGSLVLLGAGVALAVGGLLVLRFVRRARSRPVEAR